jgi:hypothetical protein
MEERLAGAVSGTNIDDSCWESSIFEMRHESLCFVWHSVTQSLAKEKQASESPRGEIGPRQIMREVAAGLSVAALTSAL